MILPLLETGLGNIFASTDMIRKKEEVFFNKFSYDVLSMLGVNLKILSIEDVLYIFRILYKVITHRF